jgi:two-component system response regulator YesN
MPCVLVVDPDHVALQSFADVLRHAGFNVVLASSGPEGIRLAREHVIDLLLACCRLAHPGGLDMLKELRREGVDVPFLILTDLVSTASTIQAGTLGDADHIERPGFAEHLLEVAHALACRAPDQVTASDDLSNSGTNPRIARVIRAIEERFAEADLTVRSVAQDIGVSTEHLCRLLKRHTGSTFLAILRDTRVRAARQLLQSSALSMKQIGDRVGFGSGSRFDHVFRKVCGVSPTKYRIASIADVSTSQIKPVTSDRRAGEP